MVETEHWLLPDFFSDHWHVFQAHLVDVLGEISIGFNRIKLWLELCVNVRIKVNLVASCCFPLQQLVMHFSVFDLLLSSLNLLDNSFLFGQLIGLFPESFTVLLHFFDAFVTDYFRNLKVVISSELLRTSNKIVKVVLWPVNETFF